MTLTVVTCECGNPEPHRKMATADGRITNGFFYISEGKTILDQMIASGEIEMSNDETAAIIQELETCGLPEDIPEKNMNAEELQSCASVLKNLFPRELHVMVLSGAVVKGILSAGDSEKVLALAAE